MAGRRRGRAARGAGKVRRPSALVSALVVAVLLPLSSARVATAAGPDLVEDPAALVNPLIGTSGAVDTFPGPDMPFGMVQWGPDTAPHRPDGGGYEYRDTELSGFSLTHVSGPGCPVAGDVPILPVSGPLPEDPSGALAPFRHADERTGIGSYTVTDAAGVTTELAAATRAGLARFTFPAGPRAQLLLKLSSGATRVDGTRARVVGDREVIGAVDSGHFCGADNRYTLHFAIRFDRPFTAGGTWSGGSVQPDATSLTTPARTPQTSQTSQTPQTPQASPPAQPAAPPSSGGNGMYLTFDTGREQSVTAAVGISYTSDAGAAANLAAEVPDFDLAALRHAAHAAWNGVLGRVAVGGGSHDQQVQFYTALYHALLHPNVFSDVDGAYRGMDGRVHRLAHGQRAQYATYSGWDTYRSQTQLMAMVAPDVTSDIVTSMLGGYDQSGLLPKWASNNGESHVMVGDPAAGIIAGAHAFGARDFDTAHALDALIHEATVPNRNRPGQQVRDALGHLPLDGSDYGCCNFYGPVSTQLEYDSADYALAWFARSLGEDAVYRKFAARAQDWTNLFNPQTGHVQGRNEDGGFAGAFTPGTSNGFVEGTSAQYTAMVPFDLEQLIAARGGPDAYEAYLDGLLDHIADPSGTDADLSNEPSVGIPWQYAHLGRPHKTQAAVRRAQLQLYANKPAGSFGNDDLGAMSSWYVWSMLGVYPEVPGTDTLVLGSPAFPRARLTLGHGRQLTINAPQAAPDAPYVQSLDVGHRKWNRSWLTFDRFRRAGTLDFRLGTAPNPAWAASPGAAPPSDRLGSERLLAGTGPAGDGLVIAPGTHGAATLTLANLTGRPVTARWTARASSGVRVEPASGTLTVPASGTARAEVTVTAGDTQGRYPVTFALTGHGGGTDPVTAMLRVAVAPPGALWPYASAKGEYPDGTRFTGGFDGSGWAYSQDALAAAGVTSGARVSADGITYTWPEIAEDRADTLDLAGQTIPQPPGTSGAALGLLGAAVNAPPNGSGTSGALTVTYTDGTTTTADVTFSDWTLGGGTRAPVPGNTTAVTTGYRNTADGARDTVKAYVFSVRVPLDPAKTVASLTLPVTGAHGTARVFAVAYATSS
jgi:predicted alpha-1,2-mannosidase